MAKQTFTSGQVLTAAQVNALQANDYNQTVSTKTTSYTLVAADVGTKIVMNSASATTITVNTSLFTAGDTLTLLNIGAGVCTITAGTATVSTTGSLALAQYGGGTLYFSSASVSVFQANGVAVSAGGLVCVKAETAFTTASNVTIDGVFTSAYTNYLMNIKYRTSTTNSCYLRMRVSAVSASTNYNFQVVLGNDTAITGGRTVNDTTYEWGTNTNGSFNSSAIINLFSPALAEPTLIQSQNQFNAAAYTTTYVRQYFGNHSTATAYDGIELLVTTGTMTGTYTIYGYAKTV